MSPDFAQTLGNDVERTGENNCWTSPDGPQKRYLRQPIAQKKILWERNPRVKLDAMPCWVRKLFLGGWYHLQNITSTSTKLSTKKHLFLCPEYTVVPCHFPIFVRIQKNHHPKSPNWFVSGVQPNRLFQPPVPAVVLAPLRSSVLTRFSMLYDMHGFEASFCFQKWRILRSDIKGGRVWVRGFVFMKRNACSIFIYIYLSIYLYIQIYTVYTHDSNI